MTTPAYTLLLARLNAAREYRSSNDKVAKSHRACCLAHDDKSPSLSIALCHDGRILVHCHAGCTPVDVFFAAGLTLADAAPDKQQGGQGHRATPVGAWVSLQAAVDAADAAVWAHLLNPSPENALAAIEAVDCLRRAGRAMMRRAA